MDIGIIVFAYNRSEHLKKVFDGLKKNKEVTKLNIFQDGLKCEEHRCEWEKVCQVIKETDWCETEYNLSPYNKGLAKSIVDGINKVFETNDAVIVLEDDCVPAANFISFMRQCFEKYQDDKRIFAVTGYSDPFELPDSEYDVYGQGTCPSWGWGTWKDRWTHYKVDSDTLKRINADKDKSRYLSVWGEPLKPMLVNRVLGLNDSWAVYWGLHIIENKGICISPYKSLIQNIGLDGTGVHCGVTNKYDVMLSDGLKHDFNLPDRLEILHTTEDAFVGGYGNYTALNSDDNTREKVLVYGLGKFYKTHEKEISTLYYIEAFIDRSLTGWYAGKKIIHLGEISKYDFDKIIMMIQDVGECLSCVHGLMNEGILAERIVLGHGLVGKYSEVTDKMQVLPDGTLRVEIGGVSIYVGSGDAFLKAYEVFVEKKCTYLVNNGRRDIVLAVGMDTRYTALYFAGQSNVDGVYAFEISDRKVTAEIDSTRSGMGSGKIITSNTSAEKVPGMIKRIVKANPEKNIILKMDLQEGNKGILKGLLQSGVLEGMTCIMAECCNERDRDFMFDSLKESHFSSLCCNKNGNTYFIGGYK